MPTEFYNQNYHELGQTQDDREKTAFKHGFHSVDVLNSLVGDWETRIGEAQVEVSHAQLSDLPWLLESVGLTLADRFSKRLTDNLYRSLEGTLVEATGHEIAELINTSPEKRRLKTILASYSGNPVEQLTETAKIETARVLRHISAQLDEKSSPTKFVLSVLSDVLSPFFEVEQLPVADYQHFNNCLGAETNFSRIYHAMQIDKGYLGEYCMVGDEQEPYILLKSKKYGVPNSGLVLKEYVLNGVRIPKGALVGVERDKHKEFTRNLDIRNVRTRFLRLSYYCYPPEQRASDNAGLTQELSENNSSLPGESIEQIISVATQLYSKPTKK